MLRFVVIVGTTLMAIAGVWSVFFFVKLGMEVVYVRYGAVMMASMATSIMLGIIAPIGFLIDKYRLPPWYPDEKQ